MSGVVPNHIKIDVDGNEAEIIYGFNATFRTAAVKSVLIEIDPQVKGHTDIPKVMKGYGFKYDPEQVEACRIKDGKYRDMANHIFYR